MKKYLSLALAALLSVSLLAGCSSGTSSSDAESSEPATPSSAVEGSESSSVELKVIKVGASPAPHAEILNVVKDTLKEQGYDLQVVEFSDYIQPNVALNDGQLDANYFQHQPYLDDYNEKNGTELASIAAIHYEPLSVYPGKTAALADLKDGAQVGVPNDPTNEARALLLLQDLGLITLKEGVGLEATAKDITENAKNLKIVEMEAAQLARSLQDIDMAVINGNYAISAGLKGSDAVAAEGADSLAANTYANVLAVRKGDEGREELKALAAALQSDAVKEYMEKTYEGAVVPKF